jgi:hypothetical protein
MKCPHHCIAAHVIIVVDENVHVKDESGKTDIYIYISYTPRRATMIDGRIPPSFAFGSVIYIHIYMYRMTIGIYHDSRGLVLHGLNLSGTTPPWVASASDINRIDFKLGCSLVHFCRYFSRSSGGTPTAFIARGAANSVGVATFPCADCVKDFHVDAPASLSGPIKLL